METIQNWGRHPNYGAWWDMNARCYDPRHPKFADFQLLSITVCEEWRNDGRQFTADMGIRPDKFYLQRHDEAKGYFPDNCFWGPKVSKAAPYDAEKGAWNNMVSRCIDPESQAWANYGGRGITVCERWLESFDNFLADMGRKTDPKLTLDRLDNEKGYEPSNCAWRTRSDQNYNKRPRTTRKKIAV